jgi:hypothetical protein
MKIVAVITAVLLSSACGSVERGPAGPDQTDDADRVEGPRAGFGPWTFGMSEAAVRRAASPSNLELA